MLQFYSSNWRKTVFSLSIMLVWFACLHTQKVQAQCTNISTGDCADVIVPLPHQNNFTGTEGIILDGGGINKTGFTMVQYPTNATRDVNDPATVYDANVRGYEPSRLTVNAGNLDILSTRGWALTTGTGRNAQLNTLGVGFQPNNEDFNIETAIISPSFPNTSADNNTGIWFGISDGTFLKLVISSNIVEFRRELSNASTNSYTNISPSTTVQSGANGFRNTTLTFTGQTIYLRLAVSNTENKDNTIYRAYIRIGNGAEIQVGSVNGSDSNFSIPKATMLTSLSGISNVSYAGVFARYATVSQSFTSKFDYFNITPVTKTLTLTPSSIIRSLSSGGASVIESPVLISKGAIPSSDVTLSQSNGSPWLTIPSTVTMGGSTAATYNNIALNFTINPAGLTVGTYLATVTASAAGFTDATYNITLKITAKAMTFSLTQLSFTAPQSGTDPAAPKTIQLNTVDVSNSNVTFRVVAGGSWVTFPTSPKTDAPLSFNVNTAGLAVGTYQTTVTASSSGYTDATFLMNLTITELPLPTIQWQYKVNFQLTATTPTLPASWTGGQTIRDQGTAYTANNNSTGVTYGWISANGTGIPQNNNNTNAAFNRNNSNTGCTGFTDDFRSVRKMQDAGNESNWEIAVPNGIYYVRVGGGECATVTPDEVNATHVINVEGIRLISKTTSTTSSGYAEATKQVIVSDGKLTIDAVGGTKTKISFIWIGQVNTINDNIKPSARITFEGSETTLGVFNNEVVVKINASDEGGSGVSEVRYSINGAPYQVYTNALLVNEVGSYAVSTRVTDGNGNISTTPYELFSVVIPTASKARLFVENLTKFPDNDNYSFSFVQTTLDVPAKTLFGPNYLYPQSWYTTNQPNTTYSYSHDVNTIRVYNQGVSPLIITGINISDSEDDPLNPTPAFTVSRIGGIDVASPADLLPLVIAQNAYVDITVYFSKRNVTPTPSRGKIFHEFLTITSNDTDTPNRVLNLHGWYQQRQENGNEPRVHEIAEVMSFKTDIGFIISNENHATPIADEIFSPYFIRADVSKPVFVRQVSASHSVGNGVSLTWWYKTDASIRQTGLFHLNTDAQTILPRRFDGTIGQRTFPGSSSFGNNTPFSLRSANDDTDPARNSYKDTDGNGNPLRGMRIWKAKDYLNRIIPNAYLLAHDNLSAGSNFDYNDDVYYVSNIRPELGSANFSELAGGNGVVGSPQEKQSSLDFGTRQLESNNAITLNLRSLGQTYPDGSSDPLIVISGVEIIGENFEEFSVANPLDLTLSPQELTSLQISFNPKQVGIKNAVLLIHYNSATTPLRIPLFGLGSTDCYNLNLYKRIKSASTLTAGNSQNINGKLWESDAPYRKLGVRLDNTADVTSEIYETDDDALYRSYLSSNANNAPIRYLIGEGTVANPAIPNGKYLVRLHFCENFFTEEGKRVNSIYMEDQLKLLAFDIFATNGFKRPIIKDFEVVVSDGQLKIDFIPSVNRPAISAIEMYSISEVTLLNISEVATGADCGANNGTMTLTANNPVGSVKYKLGKFGVYQTSGVFTGLAPGQYVAYTKEDRSGGCEVFKTVVVPQNNSALTFTVTTTNVSVGQLANGTATVSNIVGVNPFVIWNSYPVQIGSIATGLPVGTISVTVTDASGCSKTQDVYVGYAAGPNNNPVLISSIPDVTVFRNSPDVVLNLDSRFRDFDGDVLTYTVTANTNAGLVTTSFVGNNIVLAFTEDMVGTADITVRATDGGALFVQDVFRVRVNNTNVLTTQISRPAFIGRKNEPILRVQIENPLNDINATSFSFNINAEDSDDITAAKLYYTNTPYFVQPTLIGNEINNPSGVITFTGFNEDLQLGSSNYYWLVYDINVNALEGNFIDGEFVSAILKDVNFVPSTGNPTNARTLISTDKVPGKALRFDGLDDRIEMDSNLEAKFRLNSAMTLEAWIKIEDLAQNNQTIISKGNAWMLQTSGDFLRFEATNVSPSSITGDINIRDGEWHHVSVVFTGSEMILYIDGKLDIEINTNNPIGDGNTRPLWIGGNQETAGRYFDGYLDEIRIWETARTQKEIREAMHLHLQGYEEGLVSYWQLNQGTGLSASDVAGSADGTLVGKTLSTDWWLDATQPLGEGFVFSANSTANATIAFDLAGLRINFGATHPNGEIVVTKITNTLPALIDPNPVQTKSPAYWVINNYGANASFSNATLRFYVSGFINSGTAYKLYKRASNADNEAWTEFASSAINLSEGWVEFNNITSFSQAIITSSSVSLPIRLVSFTGKRLTDNQVELKWTTALEENNLGFEVERSKDGISFDKIGFVDGAGNSVQIKNYNYLDNNQIAAYYRLRQVDLDGKFSLSNIVFVSGSNQDKLRAYPNPYSNARNISVLQIQASEEFKKAEKIAIEIVATNGLSLWKSNGDFAQVQKDLNDQFSQIANGLYMVKFIADGKAYLIKIIKQ